MSNTELLKIAKVIAIESGAILDPETTVEGQRVLINETIKNAIQLAKLVIESNANAA